jgi:hypothetical protein
MIRGKLTASESRSSSDSLRQTDCPPQDESYTEAHLPSTASDDPDPDLFDVDSIHEQIQNSAGPRASFVSALSQDMEEEPTTEVGRVLRTRTYSHSVPARIPVETSSLLGSSPEQAIPARPFFWKLCPLRPRKRPVNI